MTDTPITARALMPRWWQLGSTALLYAAYLLWLVPVFVYFGEGGTPLDAGIWLACVILIQFVLAKGIGLVEYLATANEIERLSDEEQIDFSQIGDPK